MYKVFLAGGIASGKSTVAQTLESLGALRCDLDGVSRQVTEVGSPVLTKLAQAFGPDVLDPNTGELRRHELAQRAFVSEERTAELERIELPAIRHRLAQILSGETAKDDGHPLLVIEVPLLDRIEGELSLADEVLCVVCPLEVRRVRAVKRGMDAADFDRRVAHQPTDAYLRAHADTLFENAGSHDELVAQVRAWWDKRAAQGWGRG